MKAFVAFTEKSASVLCKHTADQILWIKRDFHRNLFYLAKYRTNNVYSILCTMKITAQGCLYLRYQHFLNHFSKIPVLSESLALATMTVSPKSFTATFVADWYLITKIPSDPSILFLKRDGSVKISAL